MQVTSSQILRTSVQASGTFRGDFEYTLIDGSTYPIYNVKALSGEDLSTKLVDMIPIVEQSTQVSYETYILDTLGEVVDHPYATAGQIAKAYISRANQFTGLQRYEALQWMLPAFDYVNGATDAEAAADLSITEDQWLVVKTRYNSFMTSSWVTEMYGYVTGADVTPGDF